MNTQKQTQSDLSTYDNLPDLDERRGYEEYDERIAAMADDGHGAAPRARTPRSPQN